jgi:cyclohexanone monooxygenase
MTLDQPEPATHAGSALDAEAIVIGAGFSGLRALHELRQLGMSVVVLEAGSEVGGTWYWNRYPGARTDSESWTYCYSFDDDLLQEWDWQARFPAQASVLTYLKHVADRHDMRRDIRFDTRVSGATYDEATNTWTVTTTAGDRYRCRFLIPATGFLSAAYEPPFAGLGDFAGEWYLTARWPHEPVDFTGKRVAVIGTGATGIQVIPEVAQTAHHLTVLQRTAQYAVPNRNHPLEEHQRKAIKAHYAEIWELCRRQVFGMPIRAANRRFAEVSPEQQQRTFEAGWEVGGFRFLFETFDDVTVDAAANEAACEFVRTKIRTIVEDPDTAELLCPYDHPIGAKRVPLGHHYYETYNRDNVSLVSIRDNPIDRITRSGVRLADGTEHEVDIIIFALGFDAATGAMTAMDIRGRGGRGIQDAWRDGARSFMGLAVDGFPNMFMLYGPHVPLANAPVVIEGQVRWLGRALAHLRDGGYDTMEVSSQAVDEFAQRLQRALEATLLVDAADVRSYYVGANIPGKQQSVLVYLAGAARYSREISQIADLQFDGFTLLKVPG